MSPWPAAVIFKGQLYKLTAVNTPQDVTIDPILTQRWDHIFEMYRNHFEHHHFWMGDNFLWCWIYAIHFEWSGNERNFSFDQLKLADIPAAIYEVML